MPPAFHVSVPLPWRKRSSVARAARRLPFSHEFVQSFDLARQRARRLVPRGLLPALKRFAPTIVVSEVSHHSSRTMLLVGVRPKQRSESGAGKSPSRPTASRIVSAGFSGRRFAGRVDFAIAYGWESCRYLRSIRADLPIAIGRNSTGTPSPAARRDVRQRVELLTVSRAEPDKALDVIVDAVLSLEDLDCRLTVIGDGP